MTRYARWWLHQRPKKTYLGSCVSRPPIDLGLRLISFQLLVTPSAQISPFIPMCHTSLSYTADSLKQLDVTVLEVQGFDLCHFERTSDSAVFVFLPTSCPAFTRDRQEGRVMSSVICHLISAHGSSRVTSKFKPCLDLQEQDRSTIYYCVTARGIQV